MILYERDLGERGRRHGERQIHHIGKGEVRSFIVIKGMEEGREKERKGERHREMQRERERRRRERSRQNFAF